MGKLLYRVSDKIRIAVILPVKEPLKLYLLLYILFETEAGTAMTKV